MRPLLYSLLFFLFLMVSCNKNEPPTTTTTTTPPIKEEVSGPAYAIVIHGGAGAMGRENANKDLKKQYKDAMNTALDIGENILKDGGSALDAVTHTIMYLEDNRLFNAGRGAVFTNTGTNELDASIMQGKDRSAGAVAGVTNVRHPIQAARAVMEHSDHVLFAGKGAEEFAKAEGLEIVDPTFFATENRLKSLENAKKREAEKLKNNTLKEPVGFLDNHPDHKYGTVGCVALDNSGNIVAGTSTGGMTNKRYNRVGDSPIIGAGTFADNATCGVSSTGHGEFFIRWAVAHDIAAQMEYGGKSLYEAAEEVVMKKLPSIGGSGGVIALDKAGHIAMPHNTPGMFRAYAKPGKREVFIFKDEPMRD